jgi:hypothetical protein
MHNENEDPCPEREYDGYRNCKKVEHPAGRHDGRPERHAPARNCAATTPSHGGT